MKIVAENRENYLPVKWLNIRFFFILSTPSVHPHLILVFENFVCEQLVQLTTQEFFTGGQLRLQKNQQKNGRNCFQQMIRYGIKMVSMTLSVGSWAHLLMKIVDLYMLMMESLSQAFSQQVYFAVGILTLSRQRSRCT